jgi:quercetin dioxygenase-like cupin family protein
MLILSFPDLATALRKIPFGEECQLFKHELAKDEVVEPHVETKDEWILISKGSFFILTGGSDAKIKVDELKASILMTKDVTGLSGTVFELNGNDTLVILVPAGVRHGLAAFTELEYFVLKV